MAAAAISLAMLGLAPELLLGYALGGLGSLGGAAVLGAVGWASSAACEWRLGPRRAILTLLALGSGLTLVALFPPLGLLRALQEPDGGPIFLVETDQQVFALTIDDGVDPKTTPLILDVLAEHNAHATFFVLGASAQLHPQLIERMLREGHELANHQMHDLPAVSLSDQALSQEFLDANAVLSGWRPVRWLRPGGGIVNDGVRRVARELKTTIVLGSAFPFDSHICSSAFSAAYLIGRARPGAVVILHDVGPRGERTAEALRIALPRLRETGMRCETLSTLFDLPGEAQREL